MPSAATRISDSPQMVTEELITKHIKRSESSAEARYSKFLQKLNSYNKPHLLSMEQAGKPYSLTYQKLLKDKVVLDDHRDGSIGLDSDDIDHIYQNMKTEQINSRSRTVLSRDNSSVTPEMAKSATKLKKSRLEPTFESSTKLPTSNNEDYNVKQAPFYG